LYFCLILMYFIIVLILADLEFEPVVCPEEMVCSYQCWGPTEWLQPILCSEEKPVVITGRSEGSNHNKHINCNIQGTSSKQLTSSQHLMVIHFTHGGILVLLCVILCLVFSKRGTPNHKQHLASKTSISKRTRQGIPPLEISAV